ncbi:MAG: tryptophan-rich sensory protein, partial [Akkermansiaceae bacterium]|nr:tryptophan-rich sensory protein [Akkermansiaceae bacterium]
DPPGTPPGWVFGPVWTVLYALIGAALALVWHRGEAGPPKRAAVTAWFVQFALNLLWTPVFFGAHRILPALAVIVALLAAIAITILLFRKVDRPASWLLVPYLCWVSYATYLNAGYLVLNR